MEKIKLTFIAFVKSSGLFDFITKPERVNAFIKSAVGMLAGAVETIGDIIAGILDAIAWLPFTDTQKWKGMASAVRSGTGTVSGGIRASVANLGGSSAPSVTETVQGGAKQEQQQQAAKQTVTPPPKEFGPRAPREGSVYMDKQKVGTILFGDADQLYSFKTN